MIMSLEMQLIQLDKVSTYLSLIVSILGVIGIQEAERLELEKEKGIDRPEVRPTPAEISTLAVFISLISSVITTKIAEIRFNQLQQQVLTGEFRQSLAPNVKLTLAAYLSLTATILQTVAAIEKLEQDADILLAAPF
jgi:uncharacterized membrane protein YidH (DUF202 family)